MTHPSFPPVGIAAIGVYLPQPVETAATIAAADQTT